MAALFSPRANVAVRVVLVAMVAGAVALPVAVWAFARSPAATGQYRAPAQPIPFAHALHVTGLRIDCLYCHAGADRAAVAGLPPTTACVSCHQDSLLATPMFRPLQESLATGRAIAWRRVTSVPDFVFFDHAVHVRNGVACQTCHGPVEQMAEAYQAVPLTMAWCLDCHRDPGRRLAVRPTGIAAWWRTDADQSRALSARYDVERLTSCTTCHR